MNEDRNTRDNELARKRRERADRNNAVQAPADEGVRLTTFHDDANTRDSSGSSSSDSGGSCGGD